MKKIVIALAGNPNSGKTTLFNGLTGSTAHVGNWPGVTVEKRSGIYKGYKEEVVEIVDLPGIYSLSPYTPEEVISRNFVLNEKPDCVINVIDTTNLERNLYLTTQLLEMDIPIVLAFNMIDIVEDKHIKLDIKSMEKVLSVPIVPVSALKSDHLNELVLKAIETSKNKRKATYNWISNQKSKKIIEEAISFYSNEKIDNPVFHAIKALEGDDIEKESNPKLFTKVSKLVPSNDDFEADSANLRYEYITNNIITLRKGVSTNSSEKLTKSDKIDKVLTNKWAAIPILIVIMFLVFHLVFSENFFFIGSIIGSIKGGDAFNGYEGLISFSNGYHPFEDLFYSSSGINSPGVILANLTNGLTGMISEGFRMLFETINSPEWVSGLICDGILGGVFAVIGFLPQILFLFLFFAILEDSGYMARVAFVLDRIFRKFGVSGRAFIPMIMGYGCGVPAMINTRTLSSDKERIKTIRAIPFFVCGAKLPVLVAVCGCLASVFNLQADLVTFLIYIIAFATAVISVIVLNNTTMKEDVPPFIMELPSYHLPGAKSLLIHIWDKAKHFIKKASTIILTTTIIVWLLSHLTWSWHYVTDEDLSESILASLGMFIQPIFTPLGFGYQISREYGWTYTVATINGIVAKENVISTLNVLASGLPSTFIGNLDVGSDSGVDALIAMYNSTNISLGGMMSFIVFNVLTIPCFASIATAKGELPSKKIFVNSILFWLVVSYFVSSSLYLIIDFIWPIGIIIPLVVSGLVIMFLYNRKKNISVGV